MTLLFVSKLAARYLLVLVLSCVPIYFIGLVIYRLKFHPLARFPGPLLGKITSWRAGYYSWIGDSHIDHWRLHEKYGSFVRTAPNVISTNTVAAYEAIYDHGKNVQKADVYNVMRPHAHSSTIVDATEKSDYSRKRRLLSHLFSPSALQSLEERMLIAIRILCQKLGEGTANDAWSEPRNIAVWARYCSFDIQGSLCFGKSFEMMEKDDNRYMLSTITAIGRRNAVCIAQPRIRQLQLDLPYIARHIRGVYRYNKWVSDRNREGIMDGKSQGPAGFFTYLVEANDPETGSGWTTEEIWAESSVLVVAGADTNSTGLSGSLFYLVHNPTELERVTAEIRSTFNEVEAIRSGPKLNSCKFLRACWEEMLRMSPPAAMSPPRLVLPGGLTVDGHFLPPGTVVGTHIYALQHNADYFDNPFEYRPSRWLLESNTAENLERSRSAYCAFSRGPRACVGRNQTQMQLPLMLARILYLYDIRITPGTTLGEGNRHGTWGRHRAGEYQLQDWFTAHRDGPSLQFRRSGQRIPRQCPPI